MGVCGIRKCSCVVDAFWSGRASTRQRIEASNDTTTKLVHSCKGVELARAAFHRRALTSINTNSIRVEAPSTHSLVFGQLRDKSCERSAAIEHRIAEHSAAWTVRWTRVESSRV